MPAPVPRRNSFSKPLSSDQVKLLSMELLNFSLIVVALLVLHPRYPPFLVYSSINVLRLSIWASLSLGDPGADSPPLACFRHRPKASRFCSTCKKIVPDLDHHCTWLNTCVGSANYGRFLALVGLCVAAHLFFVVIGGSALIGDPFFPSSLADSASDDDPFQLPGKIVLAAATATSLLLGLSSACLIAFHLYIIFALDMRTYDWMLYQRKAEVEKRRKAEKKRLSKSKVTPTAEAP